MNKEMIKKYWWIMGLGIVFLLVLFWPKNKNKNIDEVETITVREDIYMPIEIMRPESVGWLKTENIELPVMVKMKAQKQVIDEKREAKIKESVGIDEENGFVDKVNNLVEYTEEIKGLNQLPKTGEWNIELFKERLQRMTESINGGGNLEIEWRGISYQKLLYPRWVEAGIEDAQSVEIRGDYVINGIRISTYYGESIVGIFNKAGKLIRLNVYLIPEISQDEGYEDLANIDVVSQSPARIYGIVDDAGLEKVGRVNVTQSKIVEIFDNERNLIRPYYWLDGNTYSDSSKQPVKVSLILKAEK